MKEYIQDTALVDPTASEIRYACPQCGQKVRVTDPAGADAGDDDPVLEIQCPVCGDRMIPEVRDDE